VFLPSKEKANGMAVVIAPGGGHSQLVIDKEGYDIADWLNNRSASFFGLRG
jgi:endo-1,4-beta-xylanase